ncbi:hypothetical protein Rhal01_03763 [Rubritalea halochordaticola]|uniref:Uncharacterized protein n=1 Tax=Rubritalea halochordaticola TaxID=714537 RepID=A0ABP9V869_9BACT
MKSILALFLVVSSLYGAENEHSVEEVSDWLIVKTYNETSGSAGQHNDFPEVWMVKKDLITSIEFAESEPIVSREDKNKYVGRIVKIRITTKEIASLDGAAVYKEYVSGWMNISNAIPFMNRLLDALKTK